MIDRRQLREDYEAEQQLACLEGREFDARVFWRRYAPYREISGSLSLIDPDKLSVHRLGINRTRQPSGQRQPSVRDLQHGLRSILQDFRSKRWGARRIAKALTALNIPKLAYTDKPWSRIGVQQLLKAHGMRGAGDARAPGIERSESTGLRSVLLDLVGRGLGLRRIAAELTRLKITKLRNCETAWSYGGVLKLLRAHGISTQAGESSDADSPSRSFKWCGVCSSNKSRARCKRHALTVQPQRG